MPAAHFVPPQPVSLMTYLQHFFNLNYGYGIVANPDHPLSQGNESAESGTMICYRPDRTTRMFEFEELFSGSESPLRLKISDRPGTITTQGFQLMNPADASRPVLKAIIHGSLEGAADLKVVYLCDPSQAAMDPNKRVLFLLLSKAAIESGKDYYIGRLRLYRDKLESICQRNLAAA
jgi:hypothetical protein